MKKKVLFYNHTSTVSGAERVLLLILSRLPVSEYAPVVMCPAGDLAKLVGPASPILVADLNARFTWRPDLLIRYLISLFAVVFSLRSQVRSEAPDLIHANSIRAGIAISLATLGMSVPVTWHLHDILPRHLISTGIRLLVKLDSRIRLLAVSEATAEAFRGRLLRKHRVNVILNCANTERFRPEDGLRLRVRRELGLSDSTCAIGIIGQITERKGQKGLIAAFHQVAAQNPEARLLVAGMPLFTGRDQNYFEEVKRSSDGLDGRVRFLGARNDVPELMQALDLLVVNSLAEPCGLVVLEGMSSGLTVVATAVGGNPEMIQHGQTGWLVAPDDPDGLASSLIQLGRQPELCREIGTRARQRVLDLFTVERFMKAVTDLYAESNGTGIDNEKADFSPNRGGDVLNLPKT